MYGCGTSMPLVRKTIDMFNLLLMLATPVSRCHCRPIFLERVRDEQENPGCNRSGVRRQYNVFWKPTANLCVNSSIICYTKYMMFSGSTCIVVVSPLGLFVD